MRLFKNRTEAAHELASDLDFLRAENPVVLGLANGGVPVAAIIAEALKAPLDILLVERLSAPTSPDHVVGAVDEHGRISMIQSAARWHHLTSQQMVDPARAAFKKIQQKRDRFRSILPEIDVRNRTVIIADQGVATGAKMLGAVASVRDRGARKVVVTAPAGTEKAIWPLHESADVVVIPHRPSKFSGIEKFYEVFDDVTDVDVMTVLRRWTSSQPASQEAGVKTLVMRVANAQQRSLYCEVDLPPNACRGSGPYPAVIFAHGFESDARSPRSTPISHRLAKHCVIGVRMDFTGHGRSEGAVEDATEECMVSDLQKVFESVRGLQEVDPARIGLNGSGTGGMIALRFAARQSDVAAMVIRGPVCGDEVRAAKNVKAPTLLIHAEYDTALNASVHLLDRELAAPHQLLEINHSSRMFSDPISLELMVGASVHWFLDQLDPATATAPQPLRTNAPQAAAPVQAPAAPATQQPQAT